MALSTFSSLGSLIKSKSTPNNRPPSANLIYYYKFIPSDISGNLSIKNYATNTYDAKLTNASSSITNGSPWSGRNCFWSNGGNYGCDTSGQLVNFPSSWSLSFWMKVPPTPIANNNAGDAFCFSVGGGNATTNAFLFELYYTASSPYYINHVYVYGGGGYVVNNVNQTQAPLTSWVHYCMVAYNNNYYHYLNGTLINTLAGTASITWNANSKLYIGNGGNSLDMYFDEIRIYNTSLTSQQVQALYSYDGTWV